MFNWDQCSAVERLSGAWAFRGTRLPVKALFENLADGASLNDFVGWFPGVGLEQVLAVLDFADQSLTEEDQRRLQEPGGRTLAEIWLKLGQQ